MKTKHRKEHGILTVSEAIDTLSSVVGSEKANSNVIEQETKLHWMYDEDPHHGMDRIKQSFSVIHSYLKDFYKKEYSYVTDPQTIDGIKSIMSLVSDAAKKLDHEAGFFKEGEKGSVTHLKEYKQLNEFYHARIVHQIDDKVLGKWILALSQENYNRQKELHESRALVDRALQAEDASRHLFVDLDSVKKDVEYELFFIRKEDGSYFFSPRLLRHIHLICDFAGVSQHHDPIIEMPVWQDLQFHNAAKMIIHAVHEQIELFYHDAFKFKHRELVSQLHKCLMALLLAANQGNLAKEIPGYEDTRKTCRGYFVDFITFLREVLHSEEYHKLIDYASEKKSELSGLLLEVVHSLSQALYLHLHHFDTFNPILEQLLKSAHENSNSVVPTEGISVDQRVDRDYAAMSKLFKFHSRGPLVKMLEAIEEAEIRAFDPFLQMNIPSQLYALSVGHHKIVNIYLPSPTHQEYIHRVAIVEEFKAFLRFSGQHVPLHKHLLINLQDRNGWEEHARAAAIEELRTQEDMHKVLTTVSLPKESDFYHQLTPYDLENDADTFINHLKAHFGNEESGYYFPSVARTAFSNNFLDGILSSIHRIFFSNKNILLLEDRKNFIEIFDMFVVLKLIDTIKPNSFSLTCKDGVDLSASCNGVLFLFLNMLRSESLNEEVWERFNEILYAPVITVRERLILKERYERMLSALKTISTVYSEHGHETFGKVVRDAVGHLFKSDILKGNIED